MLKRYAGALRVLLDEESRRVEGGRALRRRKSHSLLLSGEPQRRRAAAAQLRRAEGVGRGGGTGGGTAPWRRRGGGRRGPRSEGERGHAERLTEARTEGGGRGVVSSRGAGGRLIDHGWGWLARRTSRGVSKADSSSMQSLSPALSPALNRGVCRIPLQNVVRFLGVKSSPFFRLRTPPLAPRQRSRSRTRPRVKTPS